MQCVILAGGLAKRLGALTESRPKALVEVNGRPFCDHQLELLRRYGVSEVVYCIGHLGEQIRAHLQRTGLLPIRYVDEGENLLGTGGALRKAMDEGALKPRFVMIYGDSFLPVDYGKIFQTAEARHAELLLTVYRNEGQFDQSNCRVEDGWVRHYQKGSTSPDFLYIDYGLTVFDRSVLNEIPPGEKYDLALLFERLSQEGRLMAYEVHDRFYEVGSMAGLKDFARYIESKTP